MFDCRGLHNPGRYPQYKYLTGMDAGVRDFLRGYPEVDEFISDAYSMVSRSIEVYSKRGFTSLQVGFGCTGGQHRSVYCAERLAEMVRIAYPEVVVKLIHREQNRK